MRTAIARLAGAAVLLALAACRAGDPGAKVVAVIDGHEHTVADLEAYLRFNLAPDEGDSLGPEDRDRVLSRLFDNFVDERLLLAEARRQGVAVSHDELPAEGPASAAAREAMQVQKFLDVYASRHAAVSDEAVADYLREHRERLAAGGEIVLRSVVLGSAEEAAQHTPSSFEAAAIPVSVAERDLPAPVRDALAGLEPGALSGPIEIDGVVYLFQLVERVPGERDDAGEVERRARDELLRSRRREVVEGLLDELNRRYRPELRFANLPFRYQEAG